jgi:DNA-binding NtrC family response regulator
LLHPNGTAFAYIMLTLNVLKTIALLKIRSRGGGAHSPMKNEVVVLDANQTQSQYICNMLKSQNYKTASLNSLSDFNGYMEDSTCRAVILNLDSIAVTNKILRQLKAKNPLTSIIAVSERQFHPELEEPVDLDELIFWLKTIFEDNQNQNG